MKYLAIVFILTSAHTVQSQSASSQAYVIRILNFDWMPDNTILLTLTKFDKTRKEAPVSRVYQFIPYQKQLVHLINDAGRPSPSPDGKRIAFEKKLPNNKDDLYIYDLASNTESVVLSDTLYKFGPNWSPDGTRIAYNVKRGKYNKIDICIFDLRTKTNTQITNSGNYASYNPVWSPDNQLITYYFETGDQKDQIYLTDSKGSFHRNVSQDTLHSFYPSWIDHQTLVFTQASTRIAIMDKDGKNRQQIEGIQSYFARYNSKLNKVAFISIQPENNLMVYDLKEQKSEILLTPQDINGLF